MFGQNSCESWDIGEPYPICQVISRWDTVLIGVSRRNKRFITRPKQGVQAI